MGYKTIRIGVNVFDTAITSSYREESRANDGVFLFSSKTTQFVCDEQVDRIAVVINSDSIITKVELYTVDQTYQDVNYFHEKFKTFTECIVNTIGKAYDFDTGTDREDGRMRAAWLFPDLKTMFLMYASDLSIVDRNVKRKFRLVWAVYNPEEPKKMW
jgi:hypothetical protein